MMFVTPSITQVVMACVITCVLFVVLVVATRCLAFARFHAQTYGRTEQAKTARLRHIAAALLLSLKRTHYETAKMALEAIAHKVMGTLSTFYKRQVAYELTKYGELLRSMQKMTTG
jgi:hypothetical protein